MSNWENRHDRLIFMLYCYFIGYRCLRLNIFQYICKMSNITSAYMKDVNRLKLVLVEQKRTGKWLAEQLGKDPSTISKWCSSIYYFKMVLQCYTADTRYIGQYSQSIKY